MRSPPLRTASGTPTIAGVTENEAAAGEAVEYPAGNGECETCGKKGLLARITSRMFHTDVRVCDECLDDYRRGDTEVAKMVMGRLRPL